MILVLRRKENGLGFCSVRGRWGGIWGRGAIHLLLAIVIRAWGTHPFGDGTLYLLLVEIPPTIETPSRFFHMVTHTTWIVLLVLSPLHIACGGGGVERLKK